MSPLHAHERGLLYRLQGLDLSMLGAPGLYLAGAQGAALRGLPMRLLPDEWLGSGTFRNSFYVEPWARLSRVRDLWLTVEAQGSLRVRVMRARLGQPAEVMREFCIDQAERGHHSHFLAEPQDLPAGSRLFWHIDALDGAVLHDVAWCTRTAPRQDAKLAVLMRTYRRAESLRSLLRRFADAAATSAFHAQALAQMEFWVLDSTEGAGEDWGEMRVCGLPLKLFSAPNLGGGGNASHLLQRFLEAQTNAPAPTEELLILDDDLSISMETLARYFMFCAYRQQDVICSLPVLMKSSPSQIWEDGGFWGRDGFGDEGPGLRKRTLAPHLLRHGLMLDNYAHLDEFGPLQRCEYATFIFYGLPVRVLQKIGLPAALFLRGDDVELSLRAGAAGIPVVTNPNLAAWHEPAHSHAQEYMAILHGVVINLSWAGDDAEAYAAWFEQRMVEHALLGDAVGLSVYQQVLEDLLDRDSALLSAAFETHYPARLSQWRAGAEGVLTADALGRSAASAPVRLLPFLYPGLQAHGLNPQPRVLLQDADGERCHPLPESTAVQRIALMQGFAGPLLRFHAEFDALRQYWRARLQASGEPSFWAAVAERHRPQTQLLWETAFAPPNASAFTENALTPAAHAPARELRERLERELAAAARIRRETSAPGPQAARSEPTGSQPRWWRRKAQGERQAGTEIGASALPLPPDFDPQLYLSLNQDVARTGVDPVRHYLQFGRQEGRRYRL
jgi:hypothetical protein